MPLKTALAKSKNMVSIRVLRSTGVQFAQDWVTRFGFEAEKHPAYLTMALGAGSVTPLQMASAYSVFANGGYRVNPMLITRITDNKGRVLQQSPPAVIDESMRAIDARNAFVMSQLLGEVTRSGTAAKVYATFKRMDLAGKTGTTNDSMDAWFAGYQTNLAAVVWIGYDKPRKLGDRETGGGLALPVWIDYMAQALQGQPVAPRPEPPEGLAWRGDDWVYAEFADGGAVAGIGLDEAAAADPAQAASDAASATTAPADPAQQPAPALPARGP
jgi:penicillin-binding protein 1A